MFAIAASLLPHDCADSSDDAEDEAEEEDGETIDGGTVLSRSEAIGIARYRCEEELSTGDGAGHVRIV